MGFGIGIVIFAVVAMALRLLVDVMDEDRVRTYITERHGRLLSCDWTPFGKGWFGERNNRIYEVRYLDPEGNEHHAECKTSMFSGVYFTEDHIIRYSRHRSPKPQVNSRVADLERENRRLREELKRANGSNT
ncbi:hypothetical protein CfE428DRAFT_2465 [Chthoniobacter flavus Ellin428]|uniref:Uncharacterized protein n=1 Tax=Chthoniobacter flavus Ellin428 TaxID=497964 RepID=B4D0L4_9BACT|nr:hypothetical protein [Chthoniobacter flavus]EDY19876.1 hypothetical protein CfE428DRAFT_2465 [Chthoniobacter flavus Ellin428]TCO91853.1 hypothetical protein EV701_107134 [Chthoniobacter flavus]